MDHESPPDIQAYHVMVTQHGRALAPGASAHGTERRRRFKTTAACERWCEHCRSWVRVWGVTGELRWMATHRDGDCA